jgi:protein TonB
MKIFSKLALSAVTVVLLNLSGASFTTAEAQVSASDLVVLKRVAPEYPRRAAMAGIEGSVTMRFTINSDGSVSDVQVVEAQPRRVFDRAAVAAISDWEFEPFRREGNAVATEASMSIDFRL